MASADGAFLAVGPWEGVAASVAKALNTPLKACLKQVRHRFKPIPSRPRWTDFH